MQRCTCSRSRLVSRWMGAPVSGAPSLSAGPVGFMWPDSRKQRIAMEGFHGFRRAENRAAQRMLRPETSREDFVKQIFRIVQVHLDFFEADLAIILQVFGVEFRAEH